MTELLQQALKKLSDLPADKQETIARLILSEIEQDETKTKGDCASLVRGAQSLVA